MKPQSDIDLRLSDLIILTIRSGLMPGEFHGTYVKLVEAERALIMYKYTVHTDEGYEYVRKA